MCWCVNGAMDGWVEEGAAGGSDMGWDGVSGRGEFRDLCGSTAGQKNRLFQDGIYTFGCYLKS